MSQFCRINFVEVKLHFIKIPCFVSIRFQYVLYLRISFEAKAFWSIRHLSADVWTTTVITACSWTLFTFVRRIIAILTTIADFLPGNALTRQVAVEIVACWIWKFENSLLHYVGFLFLFLGRGSWALLQ